MGVVLLEIVLLQDPEALVDRAVRVLWGVDNAHGPKRLAGLAAAAPLAQLGVSPAKERQANWAVQFCCRCLAYYPSGIVWVIIWERPPNAEGVRASGVDYIGRLGLITRRHISMNSEPLLPKWPCGPTTTNKLVFA